MGDTKNPDSLGDILRSAMIDVGRKLADQSTDEAKELKKVFEEEGREEAIKYIRKKIEWSFPSVYGFPPGASEQIDDILESCVSIWESEG